MVDQRILRIVFGITALLTLVLDEHTEATEFQVPVSMRELTNQFCIDCHSGPHAEARLDLESLCNETIDTNLPLWRNVARVLRDRSMPPKDSDQPLTNARDSVIIELDNSIQTTIHHFAQDPGPSQVRRLTNAEYEYCIEDLTSVAFDLQSKLVSDAVGGSGFINTATSQFMQDVTLERYLETAKYVSDHAMIGSGPLYFFDDTGQTGLELSAANRIQKIYRQYGFRAAAGEGAEPYGMERFVDAFIVAWKHRYREELGLSHTTLEQLAKQHNLEPKFAKHIVDVLSESAPKFPLDTLIDRWNQFPKPSDIQGDVTETIKGEADELFKLMQSWQKRFAASASAEEEAALLTGGPIAIPYRANFIARASLRIRKTATNETFTPDLANSQLFDPNDRVLKLRFSVEAASEQVGQSAVVVFRKPMFRVRIIGNLGTIQPDPVPLRTVLSDVEAVKLQFGSNPSGQPIDTDDFALRAGESKEIAIELPEGSRIGELLVETQLDERLGVDGVARCIIEDVSSQRGRQYSSLLRDPESKAVDDWIRGIESFATALPQISHREPTPSDRDPIPQPFDNTYNGPERNYFHTAIKYARNDDFLVRHILPDDQRILLDRAWVDLLLSFDYHSLNLNFVLQKYNHELPTRASIGNLPPEWVTALSTPAQSFVSAYQDQYQQMQQAFQQAESWHREDVLRFASRAWRRPLNADEQNNLIDFYQACRETHAMAHAAAIRATIVRVLTSPDFLYRLEHAALDGTIAKLSDQEFANRLSFSLWSSMPDEALQESVQAHTLMNEDVFEAQVRRMMASPKARRFATEFFGQWFGFYQFDAFRGVDANKFPEFNDRLKRSMYDEAVSFFEHLVREDRPYMEIVNANYRFIDANTAAHYGLAIDEQIGTSMQRVETNNKMPGGLLSLGAVLTTTSAPLRTSPVKRGDWILRRVLGTPVPPPPADAGSIPADDVLTDGLTVPERLAMHRDRVECNSCHVRIDPLGFALENFDTLGRWRDAYADGREIISASETMDGTKIEGVGGLKRYLVQQDESLRRTLASRLVAYILGRAENVYDAELIDRVSGSLKDDPRLSAAILTIVRSPQFQQTRGPVTELANTTSTIGD